MVVVISPPPARKTGEDFISDVFTFITDGNHVSKMVQISDSCDKRMKITDSKRDFDVASYKKSNYLYINVLYNQRLSTLYL